MKKYFQTSVFILALGTAFAFAQAPTGRPNSPSGSNASGEPSRVTWARAQRRLSDQSQTHRTSWDNRMDQRPMVDDSTLQQQIHQQFASNPGLQGVQISVE